MIFLKIGLYLLVSIAVGVVAAIMAYKRGKNPNLWFLIGFGLNIIALPLVLMGVDKAAQQISARRKV